MATATSPSTSGKSEWLVIGMTVIALLLGYMLKTSALGQTRTVNAGDLSVDLPARWVVESASTGLIGNMPADASRLLSAWDPLDPGTKYIISLLPAGDNADLATIASFRNLQRAQTLTAYRVIEQTRVTLKGQEGYKVSFAFVDASAQDRPPVVYQGVDYFFLEGGQVLVATLETYHDYTAALAKFQDFAAALAMGEAR